MAFDHSGSRWFGIGYLIAEPAKALGLTVPVSLLGRADELIE